MKDWSIKIYKNQDIESNGIVMGKISIISIENDMLICKVSGYSSHIDRVAGLGYTPAYYSINKIKNIMNYGETIHIFLEQIKEVETKKIKEYVNEFLNKCFELPKTDSLWKYSEKERKNILEIIERNQKMYDELSDRIGRGCYE